MRITIESTVYESRKKVIIEESSDDLDIVAVVDLVADALIAYGYSPENVHDAMGGDDGDVLDR